MAFAMATVSCGVKGPPEPPYPTEATVKKDTPPAATTATPAPVPFAEPKTVPATINKNKKKKKSQ
jgi:hypothetical protein